MKYTKNLKVLLMFIFMCVFMNTRVAYADVEVNISEDRTEAYSYNSKETVNVNIEDEEEMPLNDSGESFKSYVDYDEEDADDNDDEEKHAKDYDSIVDVDEDAVPGTNSYYEDTFEDDEKPGLKDSINYNDEHLADKLHKGTTYEILNKDMVVQKNVVYDKESSVGYTSIPKGSRVELVGFVTQNGKKMAEFLTESNKVYYEDVDNFYHNTIDVKASALKRYTKGVYNDANKYGTEQGYTTCVVIAVIILLGTIFCVKFLDTSVFRLKNPEEGMLPYMNSIARIMPGAMIGSFIIIANMFDSNAVAYYFHEGFSFIGKNYELIHWILQLMILMTVFMLSRIVLEGLRCFTFPCMIIRTLILCLANVASFYLCCGMSYVGVAVYVLLVLYQCICVNSYECADVMDECGDEEGEGDGEESSEESGEAEAEPEAL